MICATGVEPSDDLRAMVESRLLRMPARELSQMRVDAWKWAQLNSHSAGCELRTKDAGDIPQNAIALLIGGGS